MAAVTSALLPSACSHAYAATRACDAGQAVQALRGAGYTADWPVIRCLCDVKLLDIGAVTNELRNMQIGRELIGAS